MQPKSPEQKEKLPATTEVLTKSQLLEIIYQGQSLPQDKRFLNEKNDGVFKYFDLTALVSGFKDDQEYFFPVVKNDQLIIGLSELQKNPYAENTYWISFLSIDPDFQGQGFASLLAEQIFKFAKEKGIIIEGSSYNDAGFEKLKPLFNKMTQKYGVEFIDKGKLH